MNPNFFSLNPFLILFMMNHFYEKGIGDRRGGFPTEQRVLDALNQVFQMGFFFSSWDQMSPTDQNHPI